MLNLIKSSIYIVRIRQSESGTDIFKSWHGYCQNQVLIFLKSGIDIIRNLH